MKIKPETRERLERLTNRKIILGITALSMGLIVICISSFVPYVFKPERLHSEAFITDLIINACIVILATISMLFISQTSNAQNPKSKIAKSTAAFRISKDLVKTKGYRKFRQWIKKVQQPGDIADIKERILMSAGIEDATVLNLSIPEIKSLEDKSQIIDNIPYPALTKEQIQIVIELKSKGVKVKLIPPEYYLSARNIAVRKTKSERAQNEGRKKNWTLILSLIARLTLLLAFSTILTTLAKDLVEEVDAKDAVITLFLRLWNFFTSCFLGYLLGCKLNDIDSEYIDMRVETHYEFLEDKEFVAIDVKEEAKQEFIERMKEEQRTPMIGMINKD